MADVDFDFFDDPAPGRQGQNDCELSPRTRKHGGKKKIETKIPSMRREYSSGESDDDSPRTQKHRTSSKKSVEVAVDSDDSESESDSNHEQLNSSGVNKQAWSENTKSNGVRPKSAHPSGRSARHRNRPADSKRRSRSNSPARSDSRSRSRSGSRSGSGTDSSAYSTSSESDDSDITDVSPLSSPQSTARSSGRKSRQDPPKYGSMKPPKSPSIKNDASSRSRPTSAKLNKLLRADQDSMDLRLLMQAVLEMEQEREQEELSLSKSKQPRFVVPQSSSQRKNMSFRNDKTREIDRENTRLMQQIVRYAAEAKKKKMMQKAAPRKRQQPVVGRVLTTSAVNRKREQERIDRENQAMLKRLENAKATTSLRKDKLINDFNNHKMAGISMGTVHPLERKKRGFRTPSPYGDYGTRSRSSSMMSDTSSIRSSSTWKSSSNGRPARPQSAKLSSTQRPLSGKKTRPQSAKMTTSSRPEWESGW